jgi:hypothetical protein
MVILVSTNDSRIVGVLRNTQGMCARLTCGKDMEMVDSNGFATSSTCSSTSRSMSLLRKSVAVKENEVHSVGLVDLI